MPVMGQKGPVDLRGVDISTLDPRDIPSPPPPSSTSLPQLNAGGGRRRHRDRGRDGDQARSLFGNVAASRSMSGLQDTLHRAAAVVGGPSSGSRRVETTGDAGEVSGRPPGRDEGAKGGSPYLSSGGGGRSTPELSSSFSKSARTGRATTARTEAMAAVSPSAAPAADAQPHPHSRALPSLPSPATRPANLSRHRPATSHPPPTFSTAASHPTSLSVAAVPEVRKSRFITRRFPDVLSLTGSPRGDAEMTPHSSAPSTPTRPGYKQSNGTPSHLDPAADRDRSLKTALKSSAARTGSVDAGAPTTAEPIDKAKAKPKKDRKVEEKASRDALPKAHQKTNGSGFGLGKASRGFFSKLTRSSSSHEKVGVGIEEEYEPRLLKLPLIQQTRETRIASSYDNCRDKTEFWMPALPWRCIDYLNGKCEEEGLYRVSGGLTMVRRWRKRFDTERDINLLDESDLYDASVIASLFKEWIRELPEEIFPKVRQAKVAATLPTEVPGKKPVPQSFRDELSNLPPFNYYLLFAITCHLSLLLSHEPKNKMTLDNLYRCFNQSLKLDGRIFYVLVGDWRQCWQGCYTENEFLRKEYERLNTPFPDYPELERRPPPVDSAVEERAETSSSGSEASATGRSTPDDKRPPTSHTEPSNSTGDTDPDGPPRKNSEV